MEALGAVTSSRVMALRWSSKCALEHVMWCCRSSQSCKDLLSYRSGCSSVAYAASERMGYQYVGLPASCSCSQMRSISSLQDTAIQLDQSARADRLSLLRSARMEVCLGKAWSCAYIPRIYHGAVTSCELNHQETHEAACFDEVNAALYEGLCLRRRSPRSPSPWLWSMLPEVRLKHVCVLQLRPRCHVLADAPKDHASLLVVEGSTCCSRTALQSSSMNSRRRVCCRRPSALLAAPQPAAVLGGA